MANLLDILKETELRVRFTEAYRTTGNGEVLRPEVLQCRLLLCLYGLCYLVGFALLSRLKNLKKQRFYRPEKVEPEKFANLQPILTRPINWEIIEQQYDELIKLATALRLGTADTESTLRRFTRNNVQHTTCKALRELDKALKTTFLCDYLLLESLRRELPGDVCRCWSIHPFSFRFGAGDPPPA